MIRKKKQVTEQALYGGFHQSLHAIQTQLDFKVIIKRVIIHTLML